MPSITTQAQVIERLNTNRRRLEKWISNFSAEEMAHPGVMGAFAVKDVLAHLYDWEQRHIEWMAVVARGESPAVPAEGYTWKAKDIDRLNQVIFETHRNETVEEVLDRFHETHRRFMALVETATYEQLFTPGFYSFTGPNGTLANWLGHYAMHDGWGIRLLKNFHKILRQPKK